MDRQRFRSAFKKRVNIWFGEVRGFEGAYEKEVQELKMKLQDAKSKNSKGNLESEFEKFMTSGKVDGFISQKESLLTDHSTPTADIANNSEAMAFGLLDYQNQMRVRLSTKGKEFLKWYILNVEEKP